MGSRKKVRPTAPPPGPALIRPAVGVLLLSLGGTAEVGCAHKNKAVPPMAEPMPDPPMPDPGDDMDPMIAPMPDPGDPPMDEPPPEDAPMPPPMPDPGAEAEPAPIPPMPAPQE